MQLTAPPLLLVAADKLVTSAEQLVLTVREVDGDVLIVLRDLFAEIAAARVDNEIVRAVCAAVDLDEVVASAECAKAARDTLCVLECTIAVQREEVELLLPSLPYITPRGDEVRRLIKAREVDLSLAEIDRIHATADVDTDEVRHDLVPYRHRCADGTALTPVHIGHDADAHAFRKLIVAHPADLLDRLFLNHLRVCNRHATASVNLHAFHLFLSFILLFSVTFYDRRLSHQLSLF